MQNEVTTQQQNGTLQDFIDELQPSFEEMIADNRINFEQEKHFAIQALMNNDYLMNTAKKNSQSLKNAVLNIAAIGLSLNPVSQLAYLIPRYINKKPTVTLDISYKGLIRAATDSGSILWAQSELVYEKDQFIIKGFDTPPTHERNPFGDRGELKGAYVVVKTAHGDYLTTAMSIEEIYEIRNKSEAYKRGSGPWVDFEGEMIKKTVVKRAAKMWPRTPRIEILEKAIDVCNEVEGIDFENKSEEIKEEQNLLDQDFKRPEVEYGLNYLMIKGKFRNKKIRDVDEDELLNYLALLEGKLDKDKKYQHGEWFELIEALQDFRENKDEYYAALEGEL